MSWLRGTASQRRRQIVDMIRWGLSPREVYEEGRNDGKKVRVRSLSDVLAALKECGLGSANILEESDEQATIRVHGSLCCQLDGQTCQDGKKCFYLAGFLAGAIEGTGCSGSVQVRELSCGGFGGSSCLFVASW
jgi:predicted hydrocarbon binding protein